GASSAWPIGTPASVRTPAPLLPARSSAGTRSVIFLVPTRAFLHIALRSMTATQAGQPAKDPEDGPGANRGAPNVDGTIADGAVTVDHGQAGRDWFDVSLTSEDETMSGGTAERIAALRARLMTPMPDDRLWGWIGPPLVTVFAAIL